MTVYDIIAIILALGLIGTFFITLLIVAWSMFEDTQLGEHLLDKLLNEDKEE